MSPNKIYACIMNFIKKYIHASSLGICIKYRSFIKDRRCFKAFK